VHERERRLRSCAHVLVELVVLLLGDLALRRVHSADARLTCSSSSVATCFFASASHCSFFIRIGTAMWSEYFFRMLAQPVAERSSSSSDAGGA
jgi:hypothetical protein